MEIKRCSVGISGFDKLCEGGFVKGSSNIILGSPGAGKTTFLLQFLYNGATKYNENGAYLSFEQEPEEIIINALDFGWDLSKLEEKKKIKIIKLSPKSDIKEIREEIAKIVSKYDIQRLCIDPISLLAMNLENEMAMRNAIYDLMTFLKKLKVTTLLAEEATTMSTDSLSLTGDGAKTNTLKFLVDGVIDLYSSGLGGETDRAIRIEKMRRTKHSRGPVAFSISDKGLIVSSK